MDDFPYEKITFKMDRAHSRLLSARIEDSPLTFTYDDRETFVDALGSCRGTFVDGVLQPHTRPMNALELDSSLELDFNMKSSRRRDSSKTRRRAPAVEDDNVATVKGPPTNPKIESRRDRKMETAVPLEPKNRLGKKEAELNRREQQLLHRQQQLLQRTTPRRRKSLSSARDHPHREIEESHHDRSRALHNAIDEKPPQPDPRMSDIETRERELRHKEEILRWERKTFMLEQELAKARGQASVERTLARAKVEVRRTGSMGKSPTSTLPPPPNEKATIEPSDPLPDDSHRQLEPDDAFADFDIQAPTVQQGGQTPTEIRLPRRRR